MTCYLLVEDPDYLKAETAAAGRRKVRFDTIGLSLLVIAMASWEVVLSKGQEWDWSGDPFWRVQTLAVLFVFGLGGLIVWETRHTNPIINFRPLLERNFALSCILIFSAYAVLLGATTSLPGLLQSLFGYDALASGLVMSPSGISGDRGLADRRLPAGPPHGRPLADRHRPVGGGRGEFLDVADEFLHQSLAGGLAAGGDDPGVVDALCAAERGGVSVPARELRGAAVGLFALLRNEGGSVGTSCAQTFQERREQFHTLRLNEWLNAFPWPVNLFSRQFQQFSSKGRATRSIASDGGGSAGQRPRAAGGVVGLFRLFLGLRGRGPGPCLLVPFMKRSVAEKGCTRSVISTALRRQASSVISALEAWRRGSRLWPWR